MKLSKRIAAVTLMFAMGLSLIPSQSQAAGKNSAACKAYAAALENGTIKYSKKMNYNIADMDGDGVTDLLISNPASKCFVYSYKNGAVTKILKYLPEHDMCYSSEKNLFVEEGEGDGAWHIFHKYKNGKLKEKYRYFTMYQGDELVYMYQKAGGEEEQISKDAYTEALQNSGIEYLYTSKKKLINKLKNM